MNHLFKELRHNPLLWLLVFVPAVFVAAKVRPEAHTLLFVLSVLAIVPLAALLSHATESVAARTGDAVGGGDDLRRHAHRVVRHEQRALGVVRRGAAADGLSGICDDAVHAAAKSPGESDVQRHTLMGDFR
jgi:hypothetical protein